jgi:hypothetical protein
MDSRSLVLSIFITTCKYCPGGFWPDQKTGDHTLFIYGTEQPLQQALDKLCKNGMGQRIYLNILTLVHLHSSPLSMLNSPIRIGYSSN